MIDVGSSSRTSTEDPGKQCTVFVLGIGIKNAGIFYAHLVMYTLYNPERPT